MTTGDLFADHSPADDTRIALGEAAFVLRGFALSEAPGLIAAVDAIAQQAAFRHMVTPGGFEMSVALTNSGALGWTSDRRGYRYATLDPLTGNPWPPLPDVFLRLAHNAAAEAGFPGFTPDACLINRYVPGARMSLHQDKDEQDYSAPIVSVSLGMPAVFLFGGHRRADKAQRIPLFHGDVVVWGGTDRLRYHGVAPLKDHPHPLLGSQRINLTFRKAG
ncbi:DNA oxidative demethylase AlkB [Ralstonia pickettii]|uniref:DNA oxidative demethylase AlkB n=1 Tax=Ralstonia pickettii TaxID=329 RepID=A0A7X2LAF8_RALPI|nr:DNA oxidative demethylase AlkB [Ralstonia pickettii]MRS99139.1 DNA oxidative demethylase AlkB [Ralstonia pickettii]